MWRTFLAVMAASMALLFMACDPNASLMPREDLFSLAAGKLENQVDFFQYDNFRNPSKNRLYMHGGMFTFVNGNAGKIMELSSYGDILALYYNPRFNPRPAMLVSDGEDRKNRVAVTFDFQDPGELAVTRAGMLLVEDRSPDAQRIQDDRLGVMRDRVILRFSPERQLLDYIGQEGIGGSPFPYIERLGVTSSDDMVVICKTTETWIVYWFDKDGKRRFYVEINNNDFPVPEIGSWQPSLKSIIPDPDAWSLHVQLDYYSLEGGPGKVESRVYIADLVDGLWKRGVDLPVLYMEPDAFGAPDGDEPVQSLFEALGVASGGYGFYLGRTTATMHQLVILDPNGRVVHRRLLDIPDTETLAQGYSLSLEGILSTYLVFDDRVQISWWRTDRLLGISRL